MAVVFIFGGFAAFVLNWNKEPSMNEGKREDKIIEKIEAPKADSVIDNPVQPVAEPERKNIKQDVSFISQAPSGKWSDQTFQNGCEEASIIMAMSWVTGKSFDVKDAEYEIRKLTAFEQESMKVNVDTSLNDTANIFKQFYKYEKVYAVENITKKDIVDELQKGNILLVPAYGRDLKNPNFTSPGPITHMLVVIGYDAEKKQFITNDPGTRKGKSFIYDEDILFDAIWMYKTSNDHEQTPSKIRNKGMIIVKR